MSLHKLSIRAAALPKVPTEPSAAKLRAYCVKNLSDFKPYKSTGSNPYSSVQQVYGLLNNATQRKALIDALLASGYKEDNSHFQQGVRNFDSPQGASVRFSKDGSHITLVGEKPAKRINRPLYD